MKTGKLMRAVAKALGLAALSFGLQPLSAAPQLLPGVYGYGLDRAANPAGFGPDSRIIHVTTLEDNGDDANPTPGSLRAAVQASGPRIVVFDVSGVIDLQKLLKIRHPNITIAGQTAPSPGIGVRGESFVIGVGNVLVQHLRFRPGDRWLPNPNTHNRDAIDVDSGNSTVVKNVVIDHCTFSWALDEMASTWHAYEDVTFNKCIFAEPLYRSIHLDEGTLSGNVPKQVETLDVTPANFGDPVPVSSALAVGGEYREWEAIADGATLDFTVPIVPATNQSNEEHVVVAGLTGPDRARFKVEVRLPDDTLLQTSEVFDEYAPTTEVVSYVARTDVLGFVIPIGTASLKVRLTVVGRNPASTGWKLGLDLLSFSQGHAMGPLFGAGNEGAGRLAFNGSVIAHILERGPWVGAKHFVFDNNVLYDRHNRFLMVGDTDYWDDPMHLSVIGNTFIDGAWMGTSPRPPIARVKTPAGTQIYAAGNTYNFGDRDNAAPVFDPQLDPFRVDTDPTDPGHGLAGFVPLPAAAAYRDVLLSAGARPNDRDIMEARVMNEIAVGNTIHELALRPGNRKNSVAEAGGWPVYAENHATWTLPANPNADDDSDGYTNIEEWLQQLSAQLEGTPVDGNNYQAEFAQLAGGSAIVTNAAGAHGTGFVTAPASATTPSLTFRQVDGGPGGTRLLRIRYALAGAAQAGTVLVNGTTYDVTFAPTGGADTWTLLDVPVTLTGDNTNVVVIQSAGGLPNVDGFTVTSTDLAPPEITVPADIVTDATGADGAPVSFTVSAVDAVDGIIVPTATPASGSLFAPGVTSVHVVAADSSGNTATRDFNVTVVAHAPEIVTPPATQAVTSGANVTFTVAATGTPELSYEWRRNGEPLDAPSAPTLTLTAVQTSASGEYSVVVSNAFGSATAAATLAVDKAPATVSFGSLDFTYSGGAKRATVTTVPDRLPVAITYDGTSTPPTLPGVYTVVATVDDPEFAGSASATLTIYPDVLVRHAPVLNGAVDGSVGQLLAENVTLNTGASIGGQLLVPGTPAVQLNGHPVFGGTTDASGNASPANYCVTLNGSARLAGLLRRVDAFALPTVAAPPAPTGTRDVVLNSAGQGAGDFATLRDLTLNASAGVVAVPPGTYGNFTANGSSSFRLGVAGATEPAIYNLQALTLNGSHALEIVGPVVLTLAHGPSLNASIGNAAHPAWLAIRIASGGLTLNGGVSCFGSVTAPGGTVILNASSHLAGRVVADRFTINGSGGVASIADRISPTVALTAPENNATLSGTVAVAADASDDTAIAAVEFRLDGIALDQEDTSAPFGVEWNTTSTPPGPHVLTAVARDREGNVATSGEVAVVVADQIAPTVSVTNPEHGTVINGVVNFTATAADDVGVVGVQFQLDGANYGAELTAAPYTLAWDSVEAAPGVYRLTAVARDAAGHVTTSEEVSFVAADQISPTVVLTSPADGARLHGVVTLAATAADNAGIVGVQFKANDADLGAEDTTAPYTLDWNTAPATEGSYALTAVARDAAGHATTSAPVTVAVANAIFDTFENGAASGWSTDGGAWAVTSETGTHVWQQSTTSSPAFRAIRADTDWADQTIEADVKLLAVNGKNRFFGLMARHQPTPNDYYYLILRTGNTIELKKIVNNVAANLVTPVPFTVTPDTTYRLRLEVIGTTLKGYVNGQLKIQATDETFASGTAGLVTYLTSVAFDDVHIDPTPLSPVLVADDFEAGGASAWAAEAGTWAVAAADGSQVYRQSDSSGSARAVTGQPEWTNQLVQLDVRPQSFGQAEGWAGLLFRYTDATHYYAVVLRDGNTIELQRIDDGVVTTLASAATPVAAGTTVALRLNAVGNSFKVYRDGALILQATDDAYAAGRIALATSGAAADFDDVVVVAP